MKYTYLSFNVFFIALALLTLLATGCTEAPKPPSDHLVGSTLQTAIDHPDRPASDSQRDEQRKPVQVLSFLGVSPGMKVVDIMAGGGYYTELLSRVVGPQGVVYAHNHKLYYEFQSDKFVEQRLADQRLGNVLRWDKELVQLDLPANQIDAIFVMLGFHDFYWMKANPEQVISDLFDALKPGGTLGIVDHSAIIGSGDTEAKDMHGIHRIDEQLVEQLLTQAGFILDSSSDILRNPQDSRDKAFFDSSLIHQPTDRFVFRFIKPAL